MASISDDKTPAVAAIGAPIAAAVLPHPARCLTAARQDSSNVNFSSPQHQQTREQPQDTVPAVPRHRARCLTGRALPLNAAIALVMGRLSAWS